MVSDNPRLVFNLTLDVVAIKKFKKNNWDRFHKRFLGVVGTAGKFMDVDQDGCHRTATKALVFMLVAVNAHFKIPVAFFLTAYRENRSLP